MMDRAQYILGVFLIINSFKHPFLSLSIDAQVRLNGSGNSSRSGRVEIYDPLLGWGTVCDDSWDIHAGDVVCRQLGFSRAREVRFAAFYGEGIGHILLDEVNCKGDETDIFKCAHSGKNDHDCTHREDAGVECLPG